MMSNEPAMPANNRGGAVLLAGTPQRHPGPAASPLPLGARLRRDTDTDTDDVRLRGWIADIARGDEVALGNLYDATLGRVYGVALRITRNAQAAEDVTGDVYWQVWRQAARYDADRGAAVAWLLTIARSRALDHLRRADDAEPHPEPETLMPPETIDDGDPQDLCAATQRSHALHAVLASLDALPRQLLALAFFRGMTHEEISEQTTLPLGTVKSHIRRALAVLREALANEPVSTGMTP